MIGPTGKSFTRTTHAKRKEQEQPKPPPAEAPVPRAIPVEEPPRSPASRSTQASSRSQARQQEARLASQISEDAEREIVGGRNKPGKMVDLGGSPAKGLALTVHGVNDSPKSVSGLSEQSLTTGAQTKTLAWDDNFRRLGDSSKDLSRELGAWLDKNPGKPLTLSAHSMGSRISLAAMDDLAKSGKLKGHKVELNLVAPPLGGFDSANNLSKLPRLADRVFKNIRPSRDMGSASDFQKQLESVKLPENVKVRVFTGGKDDVVDASMPGFKRIVDNLGAQVVNFPDADHSSTVDAAARWLGNR
jgi:pimeloyl-ACP methyl ester carboxylesterase